MCRGCAIGKFKDHQQLKRWLSKREKERKEWLKIAERLDI